MSKQAVFLLCLFIVLFFPVNAYSLDLDYVENPSVWLENTEIITVPTEYENYYGQYRYFIDKFDKCVYLHIAYSESSLNRKNNKIEVGVDISNSEHHYLFDFNENGIVSGEENVKNIIDLKSEFSVASEYGQDIYFGIEFLNKYDKQQNNDIKISITVNGNYYYICKGLNAEFEEEITSVQNSEQVTKAEKTTKSEKTTAQKQKNTTSNATEKTTKYKYTQKVSTTKGYEYNYGEENAYSNASSQDEIAEVFTPDGVIITENESMPKLSLTAKILISTAVLIVILGAALVINYYVKSKSSESNDT